jgi:hypothetical protein
MKKAKTHDHDCTTAVDPHTIAYKWNVSLSELSTARRNIALLLHYQPLRNYHHPTSRLEVSLGKET